MVWHWPQFAWLLLTHQLYSCTRCARWLIGHVKARLPIFRSPVVRCYVLKLHQQFLVFGRSLSRMCNSHWSYTMALISQSRPLRWLEALLFFLFSSLVACHQLESQWNLAIDNEIRAEGNTTITIFPFALGSCDVREHPSCRKYLSNTFTLAPEVCLSGTNNVYSLFLLGAPK